MISERLITAQRRFANELKSQGLDTEGEQERLKDLLMDLDRVLLSSALPHKRAPSSNCCLGA